MCVVFVWPTLVKLFYVAVEATPASSLATTPILTLDATAHITVQGPSGLATGSTNARCTGASHRPALTDARRPDDPPYRESLSSAPELPRMYTPLMRKVLPLDSDSLSFISTLSPHVRALSTYSTSEQPTSPRCSNGGSHTERPSAQPADCLPSPAAHRDRGELHIDEAGDQDIRGSTRAGDRRGGGRFHPNVSTQPEATGATPQSAKQLERQVKADLRVLNWNCTRLGAKCLRQLIVEMQLYDIDVACLQEVCWHPVHNPAPATVAGYRVFSKHHDFPDFTHRRGGVAILARADIVCSERLDLDTDVCAVWVDVRLAEGDPLLLGTAYVPPYACDTALIPELSAPLSRLPQRAILCGDFNARNLMWDERAPAHGRSATAGEHLDTLRINHGLVLLNPLRDTYVSQSGSSTIDLAFCTPAAAALTQLSFIPAFPTSAHRPFVLDVERRPELYLPETSPPRWRTANANPDDFCRAVEHEFSGLSDHLSAISIGDQLRVIQAAFERAAARTVERARPAVPSVGLRMSVSLRGRCRARNRALKHHLQDPTNSEKKRRYECAYRAYESAMHEEVSTCDLLFMRQVSVRSDANIWRALASYTGKRNPPMYPPLDSGRAVTNLQKSQALAGRFSRASALQNEDDPRWDPMFSLKFRAYLDEHRADFVSTDDTEPYNCPLTLHELTLSLDALKPSTPGSDLLPPWFFRHTGKRARACLLQFFNASFAAGRLPPGFKQADLVPIPKPGRDHTIEKNFRPISLLLVIVASWTPSSIGASTTGRRGASYCPPLRPRFATSPHQCTPFSASRRRCALGFTAVVRLALSAWTCQRLSTPSTPTSYATSSTLWG